MIYQTSRLPVIPSNVLQVTLNSFVTNVCLRKKKKKTYCFPKKIWYEAISRQRWFVILALCTFTEDGQAQTVHSLWDVNQPLPCIPVGVSFQVVLTSDKPGVSVEVLGKGAWKEGRNGVLIMLTFALSSAPVDWCSSPQSRKKTLQLGLIACLLLCNMWKPLLSTSVV